MKGCSSFLRDIRHTEILEYSGGTHEKDEQGESKTNILVF